MSNPTIRTITIPPQGFPEIGEPLGSKANIRNSILASFANSNNQDTFANYDVNRNKLPVSPNKISLADNNRRREDEKILPPPDFRQSTV